MSIVRSVPDVLVEIDGRPVAEGELRTLGFARVKKLLSRPSQCELRFFEPSESFTGGIRVGAAIRVALARDGQEIFVGDVTAVEHVYEPARGREVRVRAYDVLHRLRKRQPVRSHVEVTVKDLARELLVEDGVTVRADEAGDLRKTIVQFRQTDLDLLVEAAAREGLYFALDGRSLRLLTLEGFGEPQPLQLGETLLEASIQVNGDGACRRVSTAAWDPWSAEAYHPRAETARSGRTARAEAAPDALHSSGEWMLCDETVQVEAEALAMAQAELDDRAAREVTLRGVTEGDARLKPGSIVDVSGVARELCGRYVLASVEHTIDAERGFVTEISTEPPVLPRRGWGTIVTVGVVTAVDDPEQHGRVKVSLPGYADVESEWAQVVIPAAGSEKGVLCLPDVGDHVVVLFARGDPAQAIVLGGVFGRAGLPDEAIDGGRVRRFTIRTAGNQVVRLDDSANLIRLQNSGGSFVELAPGTVRLHSAADLEISAPGKKVEISGAKIDFRRA